MSIQLSSTQLCIGFCKFKLLCYMVRPEFWSFSGQYITQNSSQNVCSCSLNLYKPVNTCVGCNCVFIYIKVLTSTLRCGICSQPTTTCHHNLFLPQASPIINPYDYTVTYCLCLVFQQFCSVIWFLMWPKTSTVLRVVLNCCF